MISKSAVLVGNDEFWHSAIIDDSCTTSSTDSCDEQLTPSAAACLPTAHHQLLSSDVPSYECLTGYDHRGEDTSASLFFDEDDDDMLTSDDDDDEEARMTTTSCCRQEKMSSVKKRGGGSWLLGFARLQSRPVVDEDYCLEEQEDSSSKLSSTLEQQNDDDSTPPGLVRTDSVSDCTEEDDNSTTTSTSSTISDSDNDSLDSPKKKSVGFNSTVKIQPIPHSSSYSPIQRRKMYSSSLEVRKNKIRNKKEYRFDGYDWRNVTEEWEMSVDMVTGELVHPVHSHLLGGL